MKKARNMRALKLVLLGKLTIQKPHCSLMRMSATKNL